MKKTVYIFESCGTSREAYLNSLVKKGHEVWLLECFHISYRRHAGLANGFPPSFSPKIMELIREGKLKVMSSQRIDGTNITWRALKKACAEIEQIYAGIKRRFRTRPLAEAFLESPESESIYKGHLCHLLADYFAFNELLHNILTQIGDRDVFIVPDYDLRYHAMLTRALEDVDVALHDVTRVRFPLRSRVSGALANFKKSVVNTCSTLWWLGKNCFDWISQDTVEQPSEYRFAMTVPSGNALRRSIIPLDFLVDGKSVMPSDVLVIPQFEISEEDERLISKTGLDCLNLHTDIHPHLKTVNILSLIKALVFRRADFLDEFLLVKQILITSRLWKNVMERVRFQHVISHCDFMAPSKVRNVVMRTYGVESWYYTDSMNTGYLLSNRTDKNEYHPYWSYLLYDHFVTWTHRHARNQQEHPGGIKQTHVVGCFNKSFELSEEAANGHKDAQVKQGDDAGLRIVAFDSSYAPIGRTNFHEGIAFAEDMIRLVEEIDDVALVFKEKVDRGLCAIFHEELGSKLVKIYKQMDDHKRIVMLKNDEDPSQFLRSSDLVVSFPFTSPSFIALSANRNGCWYDPFGNYRETPYDEYPNVLLHSYVELKSLVAKMIETKPRKFEHPFPENDEYMDPFRDGHAIERFRNLLMKKR